MILERIVNLQAIRKVRHLESLVKSSSFFAQNSAPVQPARYTSCLAALQQTTKPITINNVNCCLTPKITKAISFNAQQSRLASTQGDHVKLWIIERIISAALPVLLPAAFILENPIVDGILAVLVVMHAHWGLEAIILDYARPIVVGPVLPKIAFLALNIVSALTLAGLIILIYNGPGIARAIKDAWAIGKEKE